jgi:hypothetical protein
MGSGVTLRTPLSVAAKGPYFELTCQPGRGILMAMDRRETDVAKMGLSKPGNKGTVDRTASIRHLDELVRAMETFGNLIIGLYSGPVPFQTSRYLMVARVDIAICGH